MIPHNPELHAKMKAFLEMVAMARPHVTEQGVHDFLDAMHAEVSGHLANMAPPEPAPDEGEVA